MKLHPVSPATTLLHRFARRSMPVRLAALAVAAVFTASQVPAQPPMDRDTTSQAQTTNAQATTTTAQATTASQGNHAAPAAQTADGSLRAGSGHPGGNAARGARGNKRVGQPECAGRPQGDDGRLSSGTKPSTNHNPTEAEDSSRMACAVCGWHRVCPYWRCGPYRNEEQRPGRGVAGVGSSAHGRGLLPHVPQMNAGR